MIADYRQFVNRDLPLDEPGRLSKAAFTSQAEARNLTRHGRQSNGQPQPYRCSRCDMWHLGHRRRH